MMTSFYLHGLQWGRSCSERKTVEGAEKLGIDPGFNGAALVQSGRQTRLAGAGSTERASMGPLLFRAEDV